MQPRGGVTAAGSPCAPRPRRAGSSAPTANPAERRRPSALRMALLHRTPLSSQGGGGRAAGTRPGRRSERRTQLREAATHARPHTAPRASQAALHPPGPAPPPCPAPGWCFLPLPPRHEQLRCPQPSPQLSPQRQRGRSKAAGCGRSRFSPLVSAVALQNGGRGRALTSRPFPSPVPSRHASGGWRGRDARRFPPPRPAFRQSERAAPCRPTNQRG